MTATHRASEEKNRRVHRAKSEGERGACHAIVKARTKKSRDPKLERGSMNAEKILV